MIEIKTRGHLTKAEAQLLQQTLMQLRMAFVKVSERGSQPAPTPEAAPVEPAAPKPSAGAAATGPAAGPSASPDDASKVKFSKKY
jgi:hypothetical protein